MKFITAVLLCCLLAASIVSASALTGHVTYITGNVVAPEGSTNGVYLALSDPIPGTNITSVAAGNSICAAEFGTEWRWAEFHDDPAYRQWNIYGLLLNGEYGSEAWVTINDQNAECFSSPAGKGMTFYLHPKPNGHTYSACARSNVTYCDPYQGDKACNEAYPLLCIKFGACTPITEVCNGVDDDCDNLVDEGIQKRTYCRDGDGDGYGNPSNCLTTCASLPTETYYDYVPLTNDCDDKDASVNPGAKEVCDGRDNDCDGQIDEGCSCVSGQTQTCGPATTIGICRLGTRTCVGGQWSACIGAVNPTTETCNGLDDDCDGQVDEGACASCNETDGGWDYFVKGITTLPDANIVMNDLCNKFTGKLEEFGCSPDGRNVMMKEIDCPNGCKDGTCIGLRVCIDSDGEWDYYMQGDSVDKDGNIFEDRCNQYTGKLEEYECSPDGQSVLMRDVDCPEGCKNGVCLGEARSVNLRVNGLESPGAVEYKSKMVVSWTSSPAAEHCTISGTHIPLWDGSGTLAETGNLKPSGNIEAMAAFAYNADLSQIQYSPLLSIGMQCWYADGREYATDRVTVPVILDEQVCCESYGYGSQMVECCQSYAWTSASECVTPTGLVGSGRRIVDDQYCYNDTVGSCYDPDGNDIYTSTNLIVTLPSGENDTSWHDYCYGASVYEARCQGDIPYFEPNLPCPHGCQEGACLLNESNMSIQPFCRHVGNYIQYGEAPYANGQSRLGADFTKVFLTMPSEVTAVYAYGSRSYHLQLMGGNDAEGYAIIRVNDENSSQSTKSLKAGEVQLMSGLTVLVDSVDIDGGRIDVVLYVRDGSFYDDGVEAQYVHAKGCDDFIAFEHSCIGNIMVRKSEACTDGCKDGMCLEGDGDAPDYCLRQRLLISLGDNITVQQDSASAPYVLSLLGGNSVLETIALRVIGDGDTATKSLSVGDGRRMAGLEVYVEDLFFSDVAVEDVSAVICYEFPGALLPERTLFMAPLPNIDSAVISSEGVEVAFRNNLGASITLHEGKDGVESDGFFCNGLEISGYVLRDGQRVAIIEDDTLIEDGETFVLKWNCDWQPTPQAGDRLEATLSFGYQNEETVMTHVHRGEVYGKFVGLPTPPPIAECDGCLVDDRCLPYTVRKGREYCGLDGRFAPQRGFSESCENNYECLTNFCVDGLCTEPGFFRKLLEALARWF